MNRPKRANAGNRMAKVMNETECEDEFYKNCYGGFQETESDNEYQLVEEVAEADDTVDSDFSIDENEESVNDTNGEADDDNDKKRGAAAADDDDETEVPAKKPKPDTTQENEADTSQDGETSLDQTQDEASENDTTREEKGGNDTTQDETAENNTTQEITDEKAVEQGKKKTDETVPVEKATIEAENGEEK